MHFSIESTLASDCMHSCSNCIVYATFIVDMHVNCYISICRIVNVLEMLGNAFNVTEGDDPMVSETDQTIVQVEVPPNNAPEVGYEITPPGGTVVIEIATNVLRRNDKIVTSIIKRNRIFPRKRVGGGRGFALTSVIVSVTVIGRTISGLRQPVTLSLQASFVSSLSST